MANETLTGTFTNIADAIRAKSGSSSLINPLNMGNEIRDLKDLTPATIPQSNLSAVFQDVADAIRECGVSGTMTPIEMPTKIGNIVVDTGDWLCFTAEQANSTVAMRAIGVAPSVSLEYSTDGASWSPFVVDTTTVVGTTVTLANIGDYVYVRATSAGNTGMGTSSTDYNKFVMTGKIAASGNVDTLLDQNGNATLANYCYSHMFDNCTSLTTAPELPATTLAEGCYYSMLYRCAYLTTAPALPATTLATYCYNGLFRECTSLTTAPELPATTLANSCYRNIFRGCSILNSITLGYTGNFADAPSNAFDRWVDGVAASGTFYYNGSDTTTGTSAIPTGWTVISPYGGLTITAREANSTVSMIKDNGAPSVTLEYSTDSTTWNPFVVGTTTVTLNNVGDYVCFRAGPDGNTTFTTMFTLQCNKFVITGSVDLSGNLNSIISQDYDNVTTINANGSGGIGYLFNECTAIVDASKLLMKATTIGNFTYNRTFWRCSNMTKAPTIYATTIGDRYSFGDLFNGCSSLSEIKIYYTGTFGGEKTSNWVSGVPSTGTFYYNGSDTTRGASYIPTGWTITTFTP